MTKSSRLGGCSWHLFAGLLAEQPPTVRSSARQGLPVTHRQHIGLIPQTRARRNAPHRGRSVTGAEPDPRKIWRPCLPWRLCRPGPRRRRTAVRPTQAQRGPSPRPMSAASGWRAPAAVSGRPSAQRRIRRFRGLGRGRRPPGSGPRPGAAAAAGPGTTPEGYGAGRSGRSARRSATDRSGPLPRAALLWRPGVQGPGEDGCASAAGNAPGDLGPGRGRGQCGRRRGTVLCPRTSLPQPGALGYHRPLQRPASACGSIASWSPL